MVRPYLATSTALASLLAAPSALAAEPHAPAGTASWSGFYLGFNAGYVWSQDPSIACAFSGNSPCVTTSFPAPTAQGIGGGALAGINWQVGSWMVGLESDISALGVSDTAHFPGIDPNKGPDRISSQYDWLGTVRARAGFASGQALFYGTGGVAFGGVRHTYDYALGDSSLRQSFSNHDTLVGWTAGAGIAYALSANVSVKAEYLFVHLDDSKLDLSDLQRPVTLPNTTVLEFKNDLSIVRLGLNFKF